MHQFCHPVRLRVVFTDGVPRWQRWSGMGGRFHRNAQRIALYAFTKELAELKNSALFRDYLKSVKKSDILRDFNTVMGKVPNRKAEAWDRY